MGLPKIKQIPYHHVLSNQNDLKLKKGAPLKQLFNINLGIGIIKKITFFVHIFDISPCVLTQIFIRREHWMRYQICIQRVPTRHNFDWPCYPKNKKVPFFLSATPFCCRVEGTVNC